MSLSHSVASKFDTSTWTKNTWISLHGIPLFSIIANIICLYYFRQIYKRFNNNTRLQKHLHIRHKHLFIAHLIIAWYWVAIHPTINFIMVTFKVTYSFGYCYGYLMYSIMLVTYGSRMWLLYWDYSFGMLQVKMIWRKQMDNRYNSWFLSHLPCGKLRNVIIFCIILLLITNTLIGLLARYTNFSNIVHWFASFIVALLVIVLTILCIQLHNKHNLDNYNVRKEFTYQYLIYVITSISATIPYLIINNTFIRLCVVSDSVTMICFFTIIVTIKMILTDCPMTPITSAYLETKRNSVNIENIDRHIQSEQLTLMECLQDPTGINTFAEWLCGEFCVESLLFIIHVCQYRKLLRIYICEHYSEHIFDDIASMYFEIANNIPLSSSILSAKTKQTKLRNFVTVSTTTNTPISNDITNDTTYDAPIFLSEPSGSSITPVTPPAKKISTGIKGLRLTIADASSHGMDTLRRSISINKNYNKSYYIIYDYNKIALGIKNKFIKDIYGELTVNISGEERIRLCKFNFLDCDNHIELYHIFDEAFIQVLRILKQPFQRFSRSVNFKRLVKVLQPNKSPSVSPSNSPINGSKVIDIITLNLNHNGSVSKSIENDNDYENDNDAIHSVLYQMSHLMNNHCLKCC
eukprot:316649_1